MWNTVFSISLTPFSCSLHIPCSPCILSTQRTFPSPSHFVCIFIVASPGVVIWLFIFYSFWAFWRSIITFSSLFSTESVLVSCGCDNVLPQAWWVRTTQIYHLTVLEPRSSKSVLLGWNQGVGRATPPQGHKGESVPGGCQESLTCSSSLQPLGPASLNLPAPSSNCLLFSMCLNLPLPSSFGDDMWLHLGPPG